MSLSLVRAAATVEMSDDFHLGRLLLLLDAVGGRRRKPIDGMMKLAKLDFLLRYPTCLQRVLESQGVPEDKIAIPETERNTIEASMIRFRYGPWDERYRRWIGLLHSRGLALTYLRGRTVHVEITEAGKAVAAQLAAHEAFHELARRSTLLASHLAPLSGTRLKELVYQQIPELIGLRWGEEILL